MENFYSSLHIGRTDEIKYTEICEEKQAEEEKVYPDNLIIDENTVYEIDLQCMQRKKARRKCRGRFC